MIHFSCDPWCFRAFVVKYQGAATKTQSPRGSQSLTLLMR
jgi:hypothetical protein